MDKTRCNAVIYHGPGHQSKTYCHKTGPHKIHEAIYGSGMQYAEWYGNIAYSGFFDEPPDIEDDDHDST